MTDQTRLASIVGRTLASANVRLLALLLLASVVVPAIVLAIVTIVTKFGSGWYAAGRIGVGRSGQIRAGATLAARGEFSIVIAALGVTLADGAELGALVACYVLITALVGPVLARFADRLVVPRRPSARTRRTRATSAST